MYCTLIIVNIVWPMNLQNRATLLTLTAMTSSVVGSDIPLAASGSRRTTPFLLHWGTAVTYDLYFNRSTTKRVWYCRPSNLNDFTLQKISQYTPLVFTIRVKNMSIKHNSITIVCNVCLVQSCLFFPVSISTNLRVFFKTRAYSLKFVTGLLFLM